MIKIIFFLIILAVVIAAVIFGSVFFTLAMAYGYWILSIGMAPILWLLMGLGAIVGLFCTIKNAVKAAKDMMKKGR